MNPQRTSQSNRADATGDFFQDGVFAWQYPHTVEETWEYNYVYDEERFWGTFPRDTPVESETYELPSWAIGPFTKYEHNPILAPGPEAWDHGRWGGGVHNGAVVRKDGLFYYLYRGERAAEPVNGFDYLCKIGLAVSTDGRSFSKRPDVSPLFGAEDPYSYEDVNLVHHEGTYYLFCNRWDWSRNTDPSVSGCFLATSQDLIHWHEHGLVFPNASCIHRNGVVLQSPDNGAVRLDGNFVMYINDFLIACSPDLIHWESRKAAQTWPGGEGCFALADYGSDDDHVVLFTGGHHTGHFYAIGEVLFSKRDLETPLAWLPRPVLAAETRFPFENGYSASDPRQRISPFRDCIFFNGLTRHRDEWLLYYGGSEYYTCLATAPVR